MDSLYGPDRFRFYDTPLERLQREAREAATWRGHRLGMWHARESTKDRSAWAECQRSGCTAGVAVDTHPAPNGIDIGGSAVAVNCPTGGA